MAVVKGQYCIIETGTSPPSLTAAYGSFPDMAKALLGPPLPASKFETVSVVSGDALPSTGAFADSALESLAAPLDQNRIIEALACTPK